MKVSLQRAFGWIALNVRKLLQLAFQGIYGDGCFPVFGEIGIFQTIIHDVPENDAFKFIVIRTIQIRNHSRLLTAAGFFDHGHECSRQPINRTPLAPLAIRNHFCPGSARLAFQGGNLRFCFLDD